VDRANGNPGSYRYLWWFETEAAALEHKRFQHRKSTNARLAGPFRYVVPARWPSWRPAPPRDSWVPRPISPRWQRRQAAMKDDADPEVVLLRRIYATVGPREQLDTQKLAAAIIEYVRAELCRCAAGDDCPLKSHRHR
jgi:hypothetical protein